MCYMEQKMHELYEASEARYNDIADRTFSIVQKQFCKRSSQLDGNTHLEALGVDSLDVLELVMALEEEFSLEISDEQVAQVRPKTVGELVDMVIGLCRPNTGHQP